MGLFDKVKALKNAITGGAAKVYLDAEPLSFGEPFLIKVRVQVDDAPLKMDRAYLRIRGIEQVEVPDHDVVYDSDGDSRRRRETVRARHESYTQEYTIAEAQELEANGSYEFEAVVELPAHAPGIYKGRYSRHIYQALAALDCFGNDPDSGWIELNQ